MDILLVVIGVLLLLLGLIGCILPVLPGPPLAFLGLLLLHVTNTHDVAVSDLLTTGLMAAVITVLDYYLPIWGTKRFGGTTRGVWGATIGLILGLLFFPPLGIIVGPFIGAFIGEMTTNDDVGKALRSALGSLVGFLVGTVGKLLVTLYIAWVFVRTWMW